MQTLTQILAPVFFPFHFLGLKHKGTSIQRQVTEALNLLPSIIFFIHKLCLKDPKPPFLFLNRFLPSAPMANSRLLFPHGREPTPSSSWSWLGWGSCGHPHTWSHNTPAAASPGAPYSLRLLNLWLCRCSAKCTGPGGPGTRREKVEKPERLIFICQVLILGQALCLCCISAWHVLPWLKGPYDAIN